MKKECNHYGCGNITLAKGLCSYHYQRLKYHGPRKQGNDLLCKCGEVAFALGRCCDCYVSFVDVQSGVERRRRDLKDQAERANAAAEQAVVKAEAALAELLAYNAKNTEDVDWAALKIEHGHAENRARSVRWAREQAGRGGEAGMCQAHECRKRAVSGGLCQEHHEKRALDVDITSLECCGHEGCNRPLFGNGLCVEHFEDVKL